MDRRRFIQGAFAGVVGTKLMLDVAPDVLAATGDGGILMPAAPLIVTPELSMQGDIMFTNGMIGMVVFDYHGTPIGVVESVKVDAAGFIDITSHADAHKCFIPSTEPPTVRFTTVRFTCVSRGPVKVNARR
jgi:hypothetical protein